MRKCITVMVGLLIMVFATVCYAESYQMTYEEKNFTENMKDNQALTDTFTTPYGPLKFQIRKLWNSSSDKRLHFMALGMHLSTWSLFSMMNTHTGGSLNTKAQSAEPGRTQSQLKRFSTMAGNLVSPPPAMMPLATGYS